MSRAARSPYIVGPRYDWAFFLAPPLAAMLAGFVISRVDFANTPVGGDGDTRATILLGVLVHAHLVAVFARSHGNGEVRRRHPVRFFVVPVALLAAILISEWVALRCMVVATFWDVWHSGAQTFGLARIYDKKAGVVTDDDRTLDFWLNQVIYAGPILAGAVLATHLRILEEFEIFDGALADALVLVPAEAEGIAPAITWIVVISGGAFVAYYVVAQLRRLGRGKRV